MPSFKNVIYLNLFQVKTIDEGHAPDEKTKPGTEAQAAVVRSSPSTTTANRKNPFAFTKMSFEDVVVTSEDEEESPPEERDPLDELLLAAELMSSSFDQPIDDVATSSGDPTVPTGCQDAPPPGDGHDVTPSGELKLQLCVGSTPTGGGDVMELEQWVSGDVQRGNLYLVSCNLEENENSPEINPVDTILRAKSFKYQKPIENKIISHIYFLG